MPWLSSYDQTPEESAPPVKLSAVRLGKCIVADLEPWSSTSGWRGTANQPHLGLSDLVRLEEPAFSDECWATTKACAYQDSTIIIGINTELNDRAPDVIAMFGNWGFDIDLYKEVAAWQNENQDASNEDAALWWLNGNVDVWSNWVTNEASDAIKEALEANTIPDGWPTG